MPGRNNKQVLLIAVERIVSPLRPLPFTLSPRVIDRLHAVKQFIADCFPAWPGVAALCRKGETNECTLKFGFKHLFNMTTYRYHMQLKFQAAKKLLLENTESIKAIAYVVGYDRHESFTQEFRKQFGCTPSWFRKDGRI